MYCYIDIEQILLFCSMKVLTIGITINQLSIFRKVLAIPMSIPIYNLKFKKLLTVYLTLLSQSSKTAKIKINAKL